MGLATAFGVGWLIGSTITMIIFRAFLVGTLRVDRSDFNEDPYIFLELSKNIDVVTSKKYVVLKVNLKSFLPRK